MHVPKVCKGGAFATRDWWGIVPDVTAYLLAMQGRRVHEANWWRSRIHLWFQRGDASLCARGFGGDSFPSIVLLEFVPSK
jgi:hypothetical protein